MYMIYYSRNKIKVSFGKIKEENKNEFINMCNIEEGLIGGGLILNIKNNRIIGINRERKKADEYNKVLFIKYLINTIIDYNIKINLSNKVIRDKKLENKLENNDIKSICKIITNKGIGIGFLIKLYRNKKVFYCLMTNEHIITKEMINLNEKIMNKIKEMK